jgi:hypothetical protein
MGRQRSELTRTGFVFGFFFFFVVVVFENLALLLFF